MPERSSTLGKRIGRTEVHRNTYRILCAIAGVLSPTFGAVYKFIDPTAFDPLWLRFSLGALAFMLLAFSFMDEWVERHFIRLVRLFFYILTVFYIVLTAFNQFSPNYTVGMLFAMTAIGIAFTLGLKHIRPLTVYLAFTVLATAPTVSLVPASQVSPAIIIISVVSIGVVIYVVAQSKIQAEEAMKASEQRYHTLMNAANDAFFIADADSGLLVDVNQKAQELSGRSLEELRHMHLADLFPADKRKHYKAIFEKHVFEEMPISGDLYVANDDGREIPVDISASLIDVGGRQLIQGIFRDATDRHRYEEQLIHAKERAEEMLRLKTSFLNNMSHEIRTPLTSILGYAEILSEEVQKQQKEFAETITRSAKRLQKTLNSVLDLARLESGEAQLEPEKLEVTQEVEDAISMLRPLAEQKNLTLQTDLKVDEVKALLDPTCLNRIVNNLVGNAIKFTEEGGVTVEVNGNDSVVYLHIKDTGIGISDEFLEHLFDEFRQESTGLARSHEGTGLGLAITKRLVDLMGGSIDVESEKGVGTTFTIIFPRMSSDGDISPALPEEDEAVEEAAGSPSKQILVVEDNDDTRNLVKHMLGSLYDVEVTAQPQRALDLAQHTAYHALILDINLGAAQDGIDLLHDLRTLPSNEHTPAIALTAYTMPGDQDRFLEAGFDHYLGKPFTRHQLVEAVDQCVSMSLQASP